MSVTFAWIVPLSPWTGALTTVLEEHDRLPDHAHHGDVIVFEGNLYASDSGAWVRLLGPDAAHLFDSIPAAVDAGALPKWVDGHWYLCDWNLYPEAQSEGVEALCNLDCDHMPDAP